MKTEGDGDEAEQSRQGSVLVGVFVGGASRRMGGAPKGLLPSPDHGEPIVARTVRIARAVGLDVVLVGEASAYAAVVPDVAVLTDAPPGVGPLGGLAALLERAQLGERRASRSWVIALACDMPYLTEEALSRLAHHPATAPVLAARRTGDAPWEPLFARYEAARVLPTLREAIARGVRSFQRLFAELEVARLPLSDVDVKVLEDWDTPEDVQRG